MPTDNPGKPARPADLVSNRTQPCVPAMPKASSGCAPLAVIAKWLGHADAETTARIYAHSQDNALRDAAQTLGAM
jgi:hypothetical protein